MHSNLPLIHFIEFYLKVFKMDNESISKTNLIYKDETYQLIGAAMEVHRILGHGFLEMVYQEALEYEFLTRDIPFQRQVPMKIIYKGIILNKNYIADFVCFDKIVVEIKAVDSLIPSHESQLINYLNAIGLKLGLLINFGSSSLQFKRIIV